MPHQYQPVENIICVTCHERLACWRCTYEESFYCDECGQSHIAKKKEDREHSHELIVASSGENQAGIKCEAYFHRVNREIDAAERDLQLQCDLLFDRIHRLREDRLRRLSEIRLEVNRDEETVKKQLSSGLGTGAQPLSFVNMLRTRPVDTIPTMFEYKAEFPENLKVSIEHFPLNTYHESVMEREKFPVLLNNTLSMLNLDSGEFQSIFTFSKPLPGHFRSMTFCLSEQDALFCIGGECGAAFSFNINSRCSTTRAVTDFSAKSPLHAELGWAGICLVEHLLYVFGGAINGGREYLNTAQLLDPRNSRWSRLPAMPNAHSRFSPVPYLRAIYLIGGYHSSGHIGSKSTNPVDKYNLDSLSYEEIPLQEPIRPESPVASFLLGRKIVILADKSMYIMENETVRRHGGIGCENLSAQLAVHHGRSVFFICQRPRSGSHEVFRLDAQELTVASFNPRS